MRGAGSSFGIATHFYMQTEAAPSSILSFSAPLASAAKDADLATKGFETLQNLTDLTSNITFGMYIDSGGAFGLSGWCMECDLNTFNTSVFPSMISGFPPTTRSVKRLAWIDALKELANGESLSQPLGSAYTQHETFYAKSIVSKEAEPLTTASISSFFSYIMKTQGKGPFYSIINLYGGPGSAINKPSPDSSAYSDRDALWVFQNYGYAAGNQTYDPATTEFVNGLNDAITISQPEGMFKGYLNYVDPDLSPMMAAEKYYGKETYNRLLEIKMQVDPSFVFWNPQAVGVSASL